MGRHIGAAAAIIVGLFTHLQAARADFVSFSASNSSGLSATVSFVSSGELLAVVLTNTSSMDVMNPSQVLTGVWFSAPGELTPLIAYVPSGSHINNDWNIPFVGGEWAYEGNLSMIFGSDSGISAVGLGIFGADDRFAGPDLDAPLSPGGINYGITSEGDNPATGNGGVASIPLIQNSVIFILGGWDSDWSLSALSDIYFQYGSSLDGPRLGVVPEPGVLALAALGLAGLAFGARRMSWA